MLRRTITGPHRRAGETLKTSPSVLAGEVVLQTGGNVIVNGQTYKLTSQDKSKLGPGGAIYLGVAVAPDDRDFGKWRNRALLYGMYNYSAYVVAADFKQIDERMFDALKEMLYRHGVPSLIYASKSFNSALSNIPNFSQCLDEFESDLGVRFVLKPPEDQSVKRAFAGITSRLYETLSYFVFDVPQYKNKDYQFVVDQACDHINMVRWFDNNKSVQSLYEVEKRCLRYPNQ